MGQKTKNTVGIHKTRQSPLISKDTDLSGTPLVDEANIAGQNAKVAR